MYCELCHQIPQSVLSVRPSEIYRMPSAIQRCCNSGPSSYKKQDVE